VSKPSRVDAAIAAAHASQPTINAFTSIDDRAHPTASKGPLAGVPIGLKDLIDQAGMATTCGSAFYREIAGNNATSVNRLESAGGVIIGRTGLHEFAFGFSSENPHWGPVRNPWDLKTSPGGSSGGSGAAVAAGIVPIAVGTDTGGSVRVPAALCGTYGLKVTHGLIPLDGVFPLVPSIDTVGPLADSMSNIEMAYRAMSMDDRPKPTHGRLRFGLPQPWYDDSPTETEIGDSFDIAVEGLRSLGHEVHQLDMPDVFPSIHLWNAIAEEACNVHRPFRLAGHEYGDDIDQRLQDAEKVSDQERENAKEWQQTVRTRFADAFETVDFLITPTVPVRRKIIGETSLAGRHYRAVLSYFSAVVNHSLHPALAAPLTDSGGPPASIQVIGPLHSEMALMSLGDSLDFNGITLFKTAPMKFN